MGTFVLEKGRLECNRGCFLEGLRDWYPGEMEGGDTGH